MSLGSLLDICPACGSADQKLLLSLDRVPLSCAQLFNSINEARNSSDCELEIMVCDVCSHIWNCAYKPEAQTFYNDDYYSSVTESPQGRGYQDRLAKDLNLLLKTERMGVVEIGCGDGYFLSALARYCDTAVGFEPSSTYEVASKRQGIEVKNEVFRVEYVEDNLETTDLIVMRHVLEHIPAAGDMLAGLSDQFQKIEKKSYLFIEVPNIRHSLENNLFFDFYHDHIQYFSLGSLKELGYKSGWAFSHEIEGSEEFLRVVFADPSSISDGHSIHSDPGEHQSDTSTSELIASALNFARDFASWRDNLKNILENIKKNGGSIAVWGVGARGLALLAGLELPEGFFEYAIDSDKNKYGKYLPAIYLEVFPPEQLEVSPVDYVLVTSYTYFDEIWGQLYQFRKRGGKIVKVYPIPQIIS